MNLSFIEFIISVIAGAAGVVGNISAMVVFSPRRHQQQRNFHALMMGLASFDLLYILVSIFVFALPQVRTYILRVIAIINRQQFVTDHVLVVGMESCVTPLSGPK